MNTLMIIGCCNIAIGCGVMADNDKKPSKLKKYLGIANLLLGLVLIVGGIFMR